MKQVTFWLAVASLFVTAPLAEGQEVRMVEVGGDQMRVRTSGLEHNGPTTPIVVFEAGFMADGLSAWTSILEDVAGLAPIVAYDRAGVGGSESDGERPTPRHVAEKLHALLGVLGAPPPYVLVGHSWGGPLIRMYAALYPDEVAGLVYIDPTATMSAEAQREMDKAMGLSEEGRRRLDATREGFSDLPTASMRAEGHMIRDLKDAHWQEFQQLPPMPDVPVSVLMTARYQPWRYEPRPDVGVERDCDPRECHARRLDMRMSWLAKLAAEVSIGTLTVVTNAGHFIQDYDPELVVWTIRRVLETGAGPG